MPHLTPTNPSSIGKESSAIPATADHSGMVTQHIIGTPSTRKSPVKPSGKLQNIPFAPPLPSTNAANRPSSDHIIQIGTLSPCTGNIGIRSESPKPQSICISNSPSSISESRRRKVKAAIQLIGFGLFLTGAVPLALAAKSGADSSFNPTLASGGAGTMVIGMIAICCGIRQ